MVFRDDQLTVSFKFIPDSLWLPWQRNLGQNGL